MNCHDHEGPHGHGWGFARHRGRGFRNFADFLGPGFIGGPGFGAFNFRAGRKLASGDLQLVLLALLAEEPRHGYELMKALEERSGGFYAPSPGMIYPALTLLEELGYASVTADGAKKLYTITPEGRAHLTENREAADAMLAQLKFIGDKMDYMRRAFAGDDPGAEEEGRHSPGAREVWMARKELKSAIRDKKGASLEEAQRIAAILRKAAADIRGS